MDNDTQIWDGAIKGSPIEYIRKQRPRVVGVQVYTPSRNESLDILWEAKNFGAITVAGGPHIAPMYKQMIEEYPFIDYYVSGDGEYAWQNLTYMARYERGVVHVPKLQRNLINDLDELPLPAWNKINWRDYPKSRINIELGRGCDGQCVFCASWWVTGAYRHHGVEWMTEHLSKLGSMGVKHLVFQDDCLTNSESAYNTLVRALLNARNRGYSFRWRGITRVDKIERYMIRALKTLGLYNIGFGIESGSQTVLDKMNKHTSLERALKVRRWCTQEGVEFKALMMRGFPFETPETRREDEEFRKKLNPNEWGSVGYIMVFPGTKLYRDLKKEGKISDDFWLGDEPYYKLGA
jgi:radical SAM superfamily enzyme YgiQ (UPF0313 family)